MHTLMLALPQEALCQALVQEMQKEYTLTVCNDGEEALSQLQTQLPDILVLDLALTMIDGLQVLRLLGDHRPEIILALTTSPSLKTLQMAKDLGVDMVILKPCRSQAVIQTIAHLVQLQQYPHCGIDPQAKAVRHLRMLVTAEHRAGFHQLRVGLPLYLADPTIALNKELYPAIAELCGNKNGGQVEHSIREVIHESWKDRDVPVWNRYFPKHTKCPSNKEFFSNLARVLQEEEDI